MANRTILFVDDEENVLSAIQRRFHGEFDIATATSAAEALAMFDAGMAFSVVIADCRMPQMDGIQLLERVRAISPDTVRMMLTGDADQHTAVRAVNCGQVFRFLNKPSNPEEVKEALKEGLRQYELIVAEKEILNETLNGCIKVLVEVLSIVRPQAFGRTSRLRTITMQIGRAINGADIRVLESAVLLSQLGYVAIPDEVLSKESYRTTLNRHEADQLMMQPQVAAALIEKIPRMDRVALAIRYQNKHFNGDGFPNDGVSGTRIPIEARILHIALEHDALSSKGFSKDSIMDDLMLRREEFDPTILKALSSLQDRDDLSPAMQHQLPPTEVMPGMVVLEDVRNDRGILLLSRGQEVTPTIREHLCRYARNGSLNGLVKVSVPQEQKHDELTKESRGVAPSH